MKTNVLALKDVIAKSTLKYVIESTHLHVTTDKIVSKMRSSNNKIFSDLSIKNDVFQNDKPIEHDFYFTDPNSEVLPYLGLFEGIEEVEATFKENHLVLKNGKMKTQVFFADPSLVTVINRPMTKEIKYFTGFKIDTNFREYFGKIKKIASRFGRIYFTIKDNKFYIETMDKANDFSNGLTFELFDIEHEDCTMCFDFTPMVNLMSIIENANTDFVISFAYFKEEKGGLIFATNSFKATNEFYEKYYLASTIE